MPRPSLRWLLGGPEGLAGCAWGGGRWSLALPAPADPAMALPCPAPLGNLGPRLHPGPRTAVSLARPAWVLGPTLLRSGWVLFNDQGRICWGSPEAWVQDQGVHLPCSFVPQFPNQSTGDKKRKNGLEAFLLGEIGWGQETKELPGPCLRFTLCSSLIWTWVSSPGKWGALGGESLRARSDLTFCMRSCNMGSGLS